MTPPSCDVLSFRPAGDEAGKKCGYVVQQIDYCRWFGDQTCHLCNHHQPIQIDGLWGLLVRDAAAGGADSIWFSAGLDDESHGLLGLLRAS
jgi:hypothetical protein